MEVWADFFAGCCGGINLFILHKMLYLNFFHKKIFSGIGSTVIGHPIETVKVGHFPLNNFTMHAFIFERSIRKRIKT